MKTLFKILLTGLLLNLSLNASGVLTYYLKLEVWDYEPFHFSSVTVTLHCEDGTTSSLSVDRSQYSDSKNLNSRVISVDRRINLSDGTYHYFPGIPWPSNSLYLGVGNVPCYPELYYDPHLTLEAKRGTFTLNPGSIIEYGDEIEITVNRSNGYMGSVPIYVGKSADLTGHIITTIEEGQNSVKFKPGEDWISLANMFGGVDKVVGKNFFLGFYFIYDPPTISPKENYEITRSNILGGYMITGDLITNPVSVLNLCTKDQVELRTSHVNSPYIVHVQEGTGVVRTFSFGSQPITLNYDLINDNTVQSSNFYITVSCNGSLVERTEKILVTYLRAPPNIENLAIDAIHQSCSINKDGALLITLQNEHPDSLFLYSVYEIGVGIKSNYYDNNSVRIPTLNAGTYNIRVERQYTNPAYYGCYADLGDHTVKLLDKLTIKSITPSKYPTCHDSQDAELTIVTENGVGDINYIRQLPAPDTLYENNIINKLKGNTNYTFVAIDSKGCTSVPVSRTTSSKVPLSLQPTVVKNINCFGELADVELKASGGNGNETFYINGSEVSVNCSLTGNKHIPAAHSIKVMDQLGCNTTTSLSIPEPQPLQFSSSILHNLTCHGDSSGSIELGKTGGTGVVQYALFDVSGIIETKTDSVFGDLKSGKYFVTVTDANGCTEAMTDSIELTEPAGITFISFSSKQESCAGTNDASIKTVVSGPVDLLQWYDLNGLIPDRTSPEISGIGPGTYTLHALYNDESCTAVTELIPISDKDALELTYNSHSSCANSIGGGEIRLTGVKNGTSVVAI